MLLCGQHDSCHGRLLEARDFFVKQALLTGQPYPVESDRVIRGCNRYPHGFQRGIHGHDRDQRQRHHLVVKTGAGTAIEAIADTLTHQPPPTAFEIGTHRFGLLIMRLTILLVLFVLLVNALMQKPLLESFLFAVALAVGLTPELLPMVVSLTLARGALHMAKRRVIVKRLASIRNLGSMDVLCTDKTGTLTEAKIRLESMWTEGKPSEGCSELADQEFFETGLNSWMRRS